MCRSRMGNGPGLGEPVPGGLERYVTLSVLPPHIHTRTIGINPNHCQSSDGKVNQRKGVNRYCTAMDRWTERVHACQSERV